MRSAGRTSEALGHGQPVGILIVGFGEVVPDDTAQEVLAAVQGEHGIGARTAVVRIDVREQYASADAAVAQVKPGRAVRHPRAEQDGRGVHTG